MKRKVRFAMRTVYETVVDVPDDKAEGPEEKMWLHDHLINAPSMDVTVVEQAVISSVVGHENEDMTNATIF